MGTPNHYGDAESLRDRWKGPAMSQVLSSIQYICFRKTSGSNMGRQTCFLPGRHLTSLRPWRQRPYVFIRNSFVLWQPCAHGRRKGGQKGLAPLDLYIAAKKFVFLVSSGKKTNFTTFGPLRKNFWKNPLVPPLSWKKSFWRLLCCKYLLPVEEQPNAAKTQRPYGLSSGVAGGLGPREAPSWQIVD